MSRPSRRAARAAALARLRSVAAGPALLAAAVAAAPGAPAAARLGGVLGAQTTTGRVAGRVTGAADAPVPEAAVAARSLSTNVTRRARTGADGTYSLAGLVPDAYEVTVARIGQTPQRREVRVGIGQTITANFSLEAAAVTLSAVNVTASAPTAVESRTSEVSTNISQQQINNLPTPSRNFLDLAQLAPGVRVSPDRINGTGKTFAAGAQPAQNINVFVDGASYKNDVLPGGVAGQENSRGNPFPRNAVQEFRVTTSNFKAEYERSTSAIISAVTRSGTNTWSGNVFTEYQNQRFVALDTFALADKARNANFVRPDYSRVLAGGSVGGPLVRDKLFVFGSYEGNYQNRQGVTRFNGTSSSYPADVAALAGESHTSPFRSNLFFGKLTYNPGERQLFELTQDVRRETDTRAFGGQFGDANRSYQAAENFRNNVYTTRLRHTLYAGNGTNESQVGYQFYQYNPTALNPTLVGRDYSGIGRVGGSDNGQDLRQNRFLVRDDYTYTGLRAAGTHVIKLGAKLEATRYDITKTANENPTFFFNSGNNYRFPVQANIAAGNPTLKTSNAQTGLYAQDDWSPVPRLTLNVGVRWDYESNMYNRKYVTPQRLRDSLTAYRESLYIDIDPARYFTDGNDRKAFYGAVQPRVGFSYGVDRNSRTTVFGGFGVFYDRIPFNSFVDETLRAQHPLYIFSFDSVAGAGKLVWNNSYLSRQGLLGALAAGVVPKQEAFLLPNDLRPPRANQFSAGVRHDFGSVNAALTYNGTRSFNGFTYEWANFDVNANGGCCLNTNVPAYQNVLVGRNNLKTWYNALLVQVDRPYRRVGRFGWGAGLNYTLAKAEQQGRGDLFNFPNAEAFEGGRFEINSSERHRVVSNGIVDLPYLFGIQASTLITLGSGSRFGRVIENAAPIPNTENPNSSDPKKYSFIIPRAWAYRNVDVRLRKDLVSITRNRIGVTLDVFNVFNYQNFGGFEALYQRLNGTINPTYGRPSTVIADPRRIQLGAQYDF